MKTAITHNLALLLPLLLVACADQPIDRSASASPALATTVPAIQPLTPDNLAQLRRENFNPVILDVRTPKEFAAGHIPGAVNMDVNAPDFDQKIKTLDKSKPHVVYCRTGRRSTTAAEKLNSAGFRTYHLTGGITAWQKQNLPTTRPQAK